MNGYLWTLAAAALALMPTAASASTLTTLHSFCSSSPPACTDGDTPTEAVVLTPQGDVLGSVLMGAKLDHGGVFDLRRKPGGGKWHESLAYSFCRKKHCKDGNGLFSGLTADASGNVYGATQDGGHLDRGVVFKLTPDGSGGWRYSTIYRFCQLKRCLDGRGGDGTLVFDTQGNIYGTTYGGGSAGKGVAYELSPSQRDHEWTQKVLYNFCSQPNCADGNQPLIGLTYVGAASGTPYDGLSPLYGTTSFGGNGSAPGSGVVFSLTPGGGTWQESVLYAFCPAGDPCADGSGPAQAGPLSFDGQGNIYGATMSGGTGQLDGKGVLFELSRKGGTWKESVLHTFCVDTCDDGGLPAANPIMDATGNLLGTAEIGGAHQDGVIYKLSTGRKPALTTLYDFCALANCADGRGPGSVLQMDADGDLFGTTQQGGTSSSDPAGTAFEFTP